MSSQTVDAGIKCGNDAGTSPGYGSGTGLATPTLRPGTTAAKWGGPLHDASHQRTISGVLKTVYGVNDFSVDYILKMNASGFAQVDLIWSTTSPTVRSITATGAIITGTLSSVEATVFPEATSAGTPALSWDAMRGLWDLSLTSTIDARMYNGINNAVNTQGPYPINIKASPLRTFSLGGDHRRIGWVPSAGTGGPNTYTSFFRLAAVSFWTLWIDPQIFDAGGLIPINTQMAHIVFSGTRRT